VFHFRLQTVLDVRERLARIRQKEFSEVLFKRQSLEARIEEHRNDISKATQFVDASNRSRPSAFSLEMYSNFKRRLNQEIVLIEEQMREQDQELEARRAALVEAKRAQRSLEILHDKARERYEHDLSHRERVTMDEVASNYFVYTSRRG